MALTSNHFKALPVTGQTFISTYREKRRDIQKEVYSPPEDLVEMIYHRKQKSQSEILDFLDRYVPLVNEQYSTHFHSLLYLEEVGLRKEFKNMYNKRIAYFGNTKRTVENNQDIKQTFPRGIYDLEVNELFETRPSLQSGDKLTARKHSDPTVAYEGVITELITVNKQDLVMVKFGEDFVESFDNTTYSVEFSPHCTYGTRQHYAIDLATELFGMEILMPKEITLRDKPLLEIDKTEKDEQFNWFNQNLNEHQKQAVKAIIRADVLNPYLIFGPPGTGKTTTLVEIILQVLHLMENSRILITTQNNSAANVITKCLVRSSMLNQENTLRLISCTYANQCKAEIPEDICKYSKTIDDLGKNEEKVNFFKQLELVKKYRVVIGTFSTVSKLLKVDSNCNYFTHSIIDEAGQCTEPDILVSMALIGQNGQTIMAGDPMQMPPLVINNDANCRGLAIPMMCRLRECYSHFPTHNDKTAKLKSRLVSKLVKNYRSLPSLLAYTNKQFYNNELIPMIDGKTSHAAKALAHLEGIFLDIQNPGEHGIHFINVDGRNEKKKTSWFNVDEVRVVDFIVEALLKKGLNAMDIGIITPYSLQRQALKFKLKKCPELTIGTVDEFQGMERKVIVISTVRTCSAALTVDVTRKLGFVKCPKRINVATSRARVMTIVIGKAELLEKDENWFALIERCKENQRYRDSAFTKTPDS